MSKTLTVKERIQALADGKWIRKVDWRKDKRTNGTVFKNQMLEGELSKHNRSELFNCKCLTHF